jgi:hypothetical protein
LSGDAIEGKVIDESTSKPIADAIVVARWLGDVLAWPADSRTVCFHVLTATTDDDGNYRMPAWKKRSDIGPVFDRQHYVRAHKLGYEFAPRKSDNTIYLRRFKGTREDRLNDLSRSAISCSDKREIEINLLPLYKALYEEARMLAVTNEEKLKALYRLRDVERLELGSDQAWENFRQRQRNLQW